MKDTLWHRIAEAGQKSTDAVLVIVVACEGSVPGKPGAKMLVSKRRTFGTIGGGVTEARLIEEARINPTLRMIVLDHNGHDIDSVCSGRVRVLLVPIARNHASVAEQIADHVDTAGFGLLKIANGAFHFSPGCFEPLGFHFDSDSDRFTYQETIGYPRTLTIIGGGHVSLALSRIMATLPFRIRILDNRPNLPTMQENCFAHERLTVDYSDIVPFITAAQGHYVVIMTHGHRADAQILLQLVSHEFTYIGMMGSKKKVQHITKELIAKGVSSDILKRVHAPIGISIGSHTPEEIAISIAAEIILVKNRQSSQN